MLTRRREAALAAWPAGDSRHGMPTGNDEADLFWSTVGGQPSTEMPFISIAAEMWRGMRDCGETLSAIGKSRSNATVSALGANFTAVAAPLLETLRASMLQDAGPRGEIPRCFPYVAGGKECGMIAGEPSNRDSEPWRTYAEVLYEDPPSLFHSVPHSVLFSVQLNHCTGVNVAPAAHSGNAYGSFGESLFPFNSDGVSSHMHTMFTLTFVFTNTRGPRYSGAIQPEVTAEILAWHQTRQGSGVKGSRLKLGVLAGCGGDVSCGDQLETFTIHGWGYGLLRADLIEECVSARVYAQLCSSDLCFALVSLYFDKCSIPSLALSVSPECTLLHQTARQRV